MVWGSNPRGLFSSPICLANRPLHHLGNHPFISVFYENVLPRGKEDRAIQDSVTRHYRLSLAQLHDVHVVFVVFYYTHIVGILPLQDVQPTVFLLIGYREQHLLSDDWLPFRMSAQFAVY
jgi:hypothetical protein